MTKVVLPRITSGYNLSKINDALSIIESTFNDEVLFRDNPIGEVNQMENHLDMNSYRILNLPAPLSGTEPVRLKDIESLIESGAIAIQKTTQEVISDGVSQDIDSIVTSGYYYAGDGGVMAWRKVGPSNIAGPKTPVQIGEARFVDSNNMEWEALSITNPVGLGADPTGVLDSTSAFNIHIKHETDKRVDTAIDYLPSVLVWPAGLYSVSSINLTDLKGSRQIHILGYGCVLIANTPNVAVIDALSSRWIMMKGVFVYSPIDVVAKHGLQIGDKASETVGNCKFFEVQCFGYYSLSAMYNGSSETTQWYSCRFGNRHRSPEVRTMIGDGATYYVPTSLYTTVNKQQFAGTSNTNNSFYGCQFRHESDLGNCVELAKCENWTFDESCYFLTYSGAAVLLTQKGGWRCGELTFNGLWETSQKTTPDGFPCTGMVDVLKIESDGSNTALENLFMDVYNPRATNSIINTVDCGDVRMNEVYLKLKGASNTPQKLFDVSVNEGDLVDVSGTIIANGSGMDINLDVLNSFNGDIRLYEASSSQNTFSPCGRGGYSLYKHGDGGFASNRVGDVSYERWNQPSINGGVVTIQGKLNVLLNNTRGQVNISSILPNIDVGLEEVVFRVSGSPVLFVNDMNSIRTTNRADTVVNDSQTITFIRVVDGSNIWIQTAGSTATGTIIPDISYTGTGFSVETQTIDPVGVAVYSGNIFVASNLPGGEIFEYNASGALLNTYDASAAGVFLSDVTYDATENTFWVTTTDNEKATEFTTSWSLTGRTIDLSTGGTNPRGFCRAGSNYYSVDNTTDSVVEYDATTLVPTTNSWDISTIVDDVQAISYDGTNFWLMNLNGSLYQTPLGFASVLKQGTTVDQTAITKGCFFVAPDKLWVCGRDATSVHQYEIN